MLASIEPEEVVAALAELPTELAGEASGRLADPEPAVRSAALACLVRSGRAREIPRAALVSDLAHADERVRESAVLALTARGGEDDLTRLAACLGDPARNVRRAACDALAIRGDAVLGLLATELSGESRAAFEAALDAVAQISSPAARILLCDVYRRLVSEATEHGRALSVLETRGERASAFLELGLRDARERARGHAFDTLERIEDPAVVRSVRRALAFASGRRRSEALELLSNLGPRGVSEQLAHGMEAESETATVFRATSLAQIVRAARLSSNRWLHLAATCEDQPSASQEKDLMDRLLALRRVPLFAQLSIDQLESVNRLMGESDYQAGETIVREGDLAGELYVLVAGEVRILKRQSTGPDRLLGTLQPVACFGEIAILDGAPRSASVVAARDSRLLTLHGERFRELILQSPQIAFEIFPALTARIRAAEARSLDPD
jgi:hypothetical protein